MDIQKIINAYVHVCVRTNLYTRCTLTRYETKVSMNTQVSMKYYEYTITPWDDFKKYLFYLPSMSETLSE